MHNIIIHLIFKDNSVFETDTYESAMEWIRSYVAFSQDCGCDPICLDEELTLKHVVFSGLSTDQASNLNRQVGSLESVSSVSFN